MSSIYTKKTYIYIALLSILMTNYEVTAQNTPSNISSGTFNPTTATPLQSYVPDTTIIDYFTLSDVDDRRPFTDTLFNDFEKYIVARRFREGALTLGNQASSAQQIIYTGRQDIYTDIGYHQYDIYRKGIFDFPIYAANRTFTDLYFSPSDGSENFIVGAKFARSFSDNVELSLDYNRINERGIYLNQNTKATQLGIAISRTGPAKKHKLIFSFAANNFNETNNGGITFQSDGITPIDLFSDVWNTGFIRSQRLNVPVTTGSTPGQTRHQNFTYGLDNFIKLDSNRYQAHHHIDIERGYYLYGDEDLTSSNDTLLYGDYLTDSRGLRQFNKFTRISNKFDVGIQTSAFHLDVGMEYRFLAYNNSLFSEQYHDAAVFSKIGLDIKKLTSLNAEVSFGIGENVGNFKIKPTLEIYGIKGLTIEAHMKLMRYDPSIIQEQLVLTDMLIYDNEFSKINEVVIGGQIHWHKLNLDVEMNSGVIDNPVYFGVDALPVQSSDTKFLQVIGTQKFKWKFIGMENSVAYQSFTDNVYHLPRVYSIHKLYLQSFLFKKRLLSQLGVIYYNYNFDGYLKFMPANGQFYQTEETLEPFYYSELFANFKVDKFRVFVKLDNFTDLLIREPHFQIVDYPQYDAMIRFGVRWQLYD